MILQKNMTQHSERSLVCDIVVERRPLLFVYLTHRWEPCQATQPDLSLTFINVTKRQKIG